MVIACHRNKKAFSILKTTSLLKVGIDIIIKYITSWM